MRSASALAALGLAMGCAGAPPREPAAPPRFERTLAFEAGGLGLVTGLSPLPGGGVLAAGKRGAAWLTAGGRVERRIAYRIPEATPTRRLRAPGHVEPLVWGDETLFLSRGGNWHEVAVYDAAGEPRWSYADEAAPDWLAVADVEPDGELDYFVGMNGAGGLRRVDARGELVWQVPDRNVWRVETLQADDDGALELVHSNDAGELWLRDADGRALRRLETPVHVVRDFDVLDVAGGASLLLVGTGDGVLVGDPAGRPVRHLASDVSRADFRLGVAARPGAGAGRPWEWLAVLSSLPVADLSVLAIYDAAGERALEEVLLERCAGLAWLETPRPELWVGCDGRAWRYRVAETSEAGLAARVPAAARAADEAPPRSVAAWLGSGDAWGPLRFGDSQLRAWWSLSLHPEARCLSETCDVWSVALRGREFMLIPQFEDDALVQVSLFGFPRPAADWDGPVRADWEAAMREFAGGSAVTTFPAPADLTADPGDDTWAYAETHARDAQGRGIAVALYRRRGDPEGREFGVLVAISAPDGGPAPAAPAP